MDVEWQCRVKVDRMNRSVKAVVVEERWELGKDANVCRSMGTGEDFVLGTHLVNSIDNLSFWDTGQYWFWRKHRHKGGGR